MNFDYIINSINWQIIFGYGFDSYQILMDSAVSNGLSFYDYNELHELYDDGWDSGITSTNQFMLHGAPTLFFRFLVEFGLLTTIYVLSKFKKEYLSNVFFIGVLAFSFRSGQYLRFDFMFFVFFIINYSGMLNIRNFNSVILKLDKNVKPEL